jgi:HEAT repeat protein
LDNFRDLDGIIILLSKLKEKRAIPIIVEYLDFDSNKYTLNWPVIEALGNYRTEDVKEYITPFLAHGDWEIRKHARAAVAKIERAVGRVRL